MMNLSELKSDKESNDPQLSLLIVDDNENIVRAIQRLFRKENYLIHTAYDSESALSVMKSEPIQIIISDYKMPNESGLNFFKKIKHSWPDTTRFLIAADLDEISILKAIDEDIIHKFITKPWSDDDLKKSVRAVLK